MTKSAETRALELAQRLLQRASEMQTPAERRQQAELDRMIAHDADKATLVEMTDQAFRTSSSARVADQLTHVLDLQGVPRFFSPVEQAMLKGFQSFGEYLPGVAVPLVKEKMRRETANVILPAEKELLCDHLAARQRHDVVMNVNLLGEALLGEDETRERMQRFIDALKISEVRCLSVKISTLYSQISSLARQHTITAVADRLETLYRTAMREKVSGTHEGKFVYLDMEEYRDLHLTAEVLKSTLARRGLESARAGIALQAYIPDSHRVLVDLIAWSRSRVASGAVPITIRLVKGANMEMERVEASIAGFAPAPYRRKMDTDANYKRMLRKLVDAAAEGVVRVGVASHNIFDVSLAITWASDANASDAVQIEMLEGMANHQRRAISEHGEAMLLYAPACRQDEFLHAIGYLIRRLDENTGPDNFLRHAYRLRVDSPEFDRLADGFRQSLAMMNDVSDAPRRHQDRREIPVQPKAPIDWENFVNEPDTDWSLVHNGRWIEQVLGEWQQKCDDRAIRVGSDAQSTPMGQWRESYDPSRPGTVSCRFIAASLENVREVVQRAAADPSGWRNSRVDQRHQVLRQVAQVLRERRSDFIGSMVLDAGKTVTEADPEVSEAIDFCEFYPLTMRHWKDRPQIRTEPRGVVAVVTPWNFPLAIPCGGVAAALAAGNSVILKPASETVLPAWLLCQAFWDGGVPRDALQFVTCDDDVAEHGLVRHSCVSTVILTGATSTAKKMLAARPELHLLAETGGKNATIVTAMADRDQAIKHVVHSAFGHSGQKCSATSLLLLEDEVFRDEKFRRTLADAVSSLRVGSAWELSTRVGPLIGEPSETLTQGMQILEDDESWLVVPEHIVGNPNLYRPGVKWNVRPGSFSHTTELFGPVLSVMRFSRLEEAIEIVRSTGYGLTSGLESLDDREIDLWQRTIHAGNLYVNRSTTGAIVLRQPFGGVGLSAYGPGVKAGGPHYVTALCRLHDSTTLKFETATGSEPDVAGLRWENIASRITEWLLEQVNAAQLNESSYSRIALAIASQFDACRAEFDGQHDCVKLIGQDNFRRYRPVRAMTIRVLGDDSIENVLIAASAAAVTGNQYTISLDSNAGSTTSRIVESFADELPGSIHPLYESESELVDRMRDGQIGRLRLLDERPISRELWQACREAFVTIVRDTVLSDGRLECLRYLDEQSLSHDYHRYGNLGRRASESRRPSVT